MDFGERKSFGNRGGNFGPTIWEFGVYPGVETAVPCGRWDSGAAMARLDLSPFIRIPATYEVQVGKAKLKSVQLLFNGTELPAENCVVSGDRITVRQTQQVTDQTKTELVIQFGPDVPAGEAKIRCVSEQ